MTNILLIDDNADDLKLYTALILEAGSEYKIFTAQSAKEGLEIFENNPIHCAFIDYYLPELNGLRIMEQLQEKSSGQILPLIILTGSASQKIQAEAARRGAMDYIVKDAATNTPEQLHKLIHKVLDWADGLNSKRIRVN